MSRYRIQAGWVRRMSGLVGHVTQGNLSRETKFSGVNGGQEKKIIFPIQLRPRARLTTTSGRCVSAIGRSSMMTTGIV